MITCTFENGNKDYLRHVVIDAIVIRDDKILLVKRIKKILGGGKWSIIGGFMSRDEDVYETVEREIFEETGWRVEDITLLRIKHWPDRPKENRQNVAFTFFARATKQEGEKDWESTEVKWFSLDKLPVREDIAFDHADDIDIYKKYLKVKFDLPLLKKL